MEQFMNRVRFEAERVMGNKASTRLGTVDGYDPNTYCVKVALQPDATITGWIPVGTLWIGNGWGMFCPPSPGDQIVVEFQEDDHEVPVAALRLFGNVNRPLAVQSGEMWLVHKTGSSVKLTNDGKVLVNSGTEVDIGNLVNALKTLVTSDFMALFNNHTHTSAASGSPTSVPLTPMTAAHLTTVLKAN